MASPSMPLRMSMKPKARGTFTPLGSSVMMRAPRWAGRIRDLYRHEQRFRLREFLLPTEQNTRRYPIAPRHLRQAGPRPRRFLDDPAFVPPADLPPMALACGRHDRT